MTSTHGRTLVADPRYSPSQQGSPAVFLDRDGTLVHSRHYPSRPGDLILFADIGPGLRALRALGFRLVVVTNQSGIARGYITEADLAVMHRHLAAELSRTGVVLDGIYFCPHHPDGSVREYSFRCACRKPSPGMILRAADDLALDLSHSWMVGDVPADVEAGRRGGCRTVLVRHPGETCEGAIPRDSDFVTRSTREALDIIRDQALARNPSSGLITQDRYHGNHFSSGSAVAAHVPAIPAWAGETAACPGSHRDACESSERSGSDARRGA